MIKEKILSHRNQRGWWYNLSYSLNFASVFSCIKLVLVSWANFIFFLAFILPFKIFFALSFGKPYTINLLEDLG